MLHCEASEQILETLKIKMFIFHEYNYMYAAMLLAYLHLFLYDYIPGEGLYSLKSLVHIYHELINKS